MEKWPDRPDLMTVPAAADEETIAVAFFECLSTSPGTIVLDYLYWNIMMKEPMDLRGVGQQDLVRVIIGFMQRGRVRQQQGGHHGNLDYDFT